MGARAATRATGAAPRRWGAEHHGNELVDVAIVCTPKPDAIAGGRGGRRARRHALPLRAARARARRCRSTAPTLFLRELTVTASYSAGPGDMRAALELIAGAPDRSARRSSRTGCRSTRPGTALELQRSADGLKVVVEP